MPIYLDANASMPVCEEAKSALISTLSLAGNASSPHNMGRHLRRVLDGAREAVAVALGGQEKEVFFTSGASEGNRWLVDAIIKSGRLLGRPHFVVASALEHPSLIKPLVEAASFGLLHLHIFKDLNDPRLCEAEIVFCTAAHNETGIILDLGKIANSISEKAILISDASQAMARVEILPERVDAIVASAHKMGGVAGCGAVLLRGNARRLPAPWAGGGQEGGLRPGTESVALVAAFGAAASVISRSRQEHAKLRPLRDMTERELLAAWPHARVIGQTESRLPNTSAIMLDGIDGEALRIAIDASGVCVGFGSACSALAPEPSPSMIALGLTASQARSTIRLSLSPGQSEQELNVAIERLTGCGRLPSAFAA